MWVVHIFNLVVFYIVFSGILWLKLNHPNWLNQSTYIDQAWLDKLEYNWEFRITYRISAGSSLLTLLLLSWKLEPQTSSTNPWREHGQWDTQNVHVPDKILGYNLDREKVMIIWTVGLRYGGLGFVLCRL